MDYREYILSGIIEDYCLGILNEEESKAVETQAEMHIEIKQEIDAYMQALEQYALDNPFNPMPDVRNNLIGIFENLQAEQYATIDKLPLLNKYSDHTNWLRIVEPVLPGKFNENVFIRQLQKKEGVSQILIWSAVDYPDEVHDDCLESFIILKGKCRCHIGDDTVVELGPGGFLEIPLHKHHDVVVMEPVLAVIQRVKVA